MKQTPLLLSREQKFAALAAIPPERVGVSRTRWAQVVDLLTQIELRTGQGVCHCYVETLAAVMNRGVGVSLPTFHRVRRVAEDLELLVRKLRHSGHHQQSNEWRIRWDRVSLLAGDAPAEAPQLAPPKSDTLVRKSDTLGCQSDTPRCQSDTLYKRNSSTVVQPYPRSTVDGDRVDSHSRRGGSLALTEDQRRLARVAWRRVAVTHGIRPGGPRDLSLVVKAAALAAHGPLCEAWLMDAIDGLAHRSGAPPWRWLHATLRNNAAERYRVDFDAELRRVRLPAELIAELCQLDHDPRLCAAGREPT